MSHSIWRVISDGNTYRSLDNPSVNPGVFLDLNDMLRDGKAIGETWDPPELYLYDEPGEESKPISNFPCFSGFFVIDKRALENLYPVIESSIIEILPLPSSIEDLSVLNIEMLDCIDHSRSQFKHFSSGRIMRVEKYAFVQRNLIDKHIFRLPEESFTKVFVDDEFKTIVEENELHGLLFYPLDQV